MSGNIWDWYLEQIRRKDAEIERLRTLLTSEGICLECGSRGCDCQEGE
jgi:hypothetical protein